MTTNLILINVLASGELALLLDDVEKAEQIFTELVFRNPENHK